MTIRDKAFLQLLSDAIGTGTHEELPVLSEEDWRSVFTLAKQHHVLPLIVDEIYQREPAVPTPVFPLYRKQAVRLVHLQTAKTAAFLSLYQYLSRRGMEPLVMKGTICRALYPSPDFRFSADEDLLIRPDEALAYHKALTAYGLTADRPEDEIADAHETGYVSADRILYLEVHRTPFPADAAAYGEYNEFFREAYENAETVYIDNIPLKTLSPTDHLFYLICHALKHFLHGGFGIRQVCDICLFARKNREEIHWEQFVSRLKTIQGEIFTGALFAIGERYLNIPVPWREEEQVSQEDGRKLLPGEDTDQIKMDQIDPEDLLTDILASGVFGSSSLSRKHSSGITLNALEKGKERNAGRHSWLRILFPPITGLRERYPYLKKHPILLPAAWGERIITYLCSRNKRDNSAKEALRLGKERKALLKKYGLIRVPGKRSGASNQSGGHNGNDSYTGVIDPGKRIVDTNAYISSLLELIREGHEVSLPVVGSSMTPFLGDGRDRVFLRAADTELKKGDIVLYQRENGDYVLHRICRIERGSHNDSKESAELYGIVGDAQSRIERGVRREQIFAKAVCVERKGKLKTPGSIYWMFFEYIWVNIIPMRNLILRVYAGSRRKRRNK